MEKNAQKILDFYSTHRRMPGYKEISKLTGFRSKNAVYKLINRMVEEGLVEKDREGRISPRRGYDEVPLLGLVEAGIPAEATEEKLDSLSLDDFLIEKKDKTYLLEVKGESMIEEHIAPGDLVIVEKTNHAKDGDIVVADVDGEWTMKYYRSRDGKVWLEPANKSFDPIYPKEYLNVAAVVRGVIRKY